MPPTFIAKAYQCKDCIYAYNPKKGDPSQGVEPGTSFEELPESWCCPICKAAKKRFRALN